MERGQTPEHGEDAASEKPKRKSDWDDSVPASIPSVAPSYHKPATLATVTDRRDLGIHCNDLHIVWKMGKSFSVSRVINSSNPTALGPRSGPSRRSSGLFAARQRRAGFPKRDSEERREKERMRE